ncbi:MAG: hypothetical protein ABSB91_04565 [Sedimentisphaerales bacterium]|jgi:hypothetical protein
MEGSTPNQRPQESAEKMRLAIEKLRQEVLKPDVPPERKLPWLIDILLYPTSIAGLVHLALFVLVPSLVSVFLRLLGVLLAPSLREGTGYIISWVAVPFNAVFYCYVLYYLSHCVIDSARGQIRAPDITTETFDFGDLFSRAVVLFGCVAICFWPVAVYYIFTLRTDMWYWLLCGYSVFVLPMSLLSGIIFDSLDALNPITLARSIIKTLFSYLKLLLLLCVISGLAVVVLPRVLPLVFLARIVRIYLCFVVLHLLGRFYFRYQEKLNWEV